MCGCDRSLDHMKAPARSAVRFAVVDKLPPGTNKGAANLATGQISVQRDWWARFSKAQQDVVLAHEVGHLNGADCEPCADRVAGAIMRQWGYSRRCATEAIGSAVRNRPGAALRCGQGWDATHRSLDTSRIGTLTAKQPVMTTTGKTLAVTAPTSLAIRGTTATGTAWVEKAPVTATTGTVQTEKAPVTTGGALPTAGAPTLRPGTHVDPLPGETSGGGIASPAESAIKPDSTMGPIVIAVVAGAVLWLIFKGAA